MDGWLDTMVTRFRVETNRPTQRLTLQVSLLSPLLKNYRDAFSDPNWQNAMRDEYSALIKNKLRFYRYKARLVANGSTQIEGVDVDETFSPIVKPGTIQFLVSYFSTLADSSARYQERFPSSAEAEYRDIANAVTETCWLRNLLRELHTPLFFAMLVYCDNVSAVYLSFNLVQHQRMNYIAIDIHFVQALVVASQVRVLHVHSRYQFADIFTKGLHFALFEEFRTSLSV
nr:NBS-containing resistance-like protein [Tanacetum cinerariifolium]